MTALTTAGIVALGGAAPARADGVSDFTGYLGYVKQAYDAYQKFFGHTLTLDEATTRIENAITAAKTEILNEVDAVATADVQACARSAVIEVADIRRLSPDSLQAFAMAATSCATLAQSDISNVSQLASVNQLGLALNTVGPIALFARTYAGLSTGLLRQTLVSANQTVVTRLTPSCFATPLWGDAEPGARSVEAQLQCTAFNGNTGLDWVVVRGLRYGQALPPLPASTYAYATTQAMRATSYESSTAALPELAA
ncbi:MAG TPA: hypothetical protein VIU15_29055 [Streptomyces sp.]